MNSESCVASGQVGPAPVDIGALAQRIRPRQRPGLMLAWWCAFLILLAACLFPGPATVIPAMLVVLIGMRYRQMGRRRYLRNLAGLPCLSAAADIDATGRTWPRVAALVPARNEEDSIDAAARSLASLPYPDLSVWFLNDHSTDRTPQILDAIKEDFPNVHVVHDPPVTEGWFGKSNALWNAFERTEASHEWLLFADADVVFGPGILKQAVALAERDDLDFLTCLPRMITKSWSEQLLLPNGWREIVQGGAYERLNDPRSFPIGIGAFILVKRSTYVACGGHKALANWHPEDALLAAAVKAIGGRVGLAWTPDLLRIRMYHGYRQIKTYTLRKLRMFYGDRFETPLTMMAKRLSTMIMPLPMMAVGVVGQVMLGHFDAYLALLAFAGLLQYIDEAREFTGVDRIVDYHPIVPWLHPVSGAVRIWLALSVIGQILTRRPMEWRGRAEFGTTWMTQDGNDAGVQSGTISPRPGLD